MKILQALAEGKKILYSKQVDSPRLDAELLLAFALKKSREFLLTYPEKKLKPLEVSKYRNLVRRRACREPLAHLTHKKEFYGLEFYIDENVLIPRPETETIVEGMLSVLADFRDREILQGGQNLLVDVGTGSGCIAIAIAKKLRITKFKDLKIFATDSSPRALRVAKKNAKLHGTTKNITFLRGNLLKPIFSQFYRSIELENLAVVANLPYLTPREWKKTQPEIKKYEPRGALVGGKDGLKYYKMLLKQLDKACRSNKINRITCFFEINPRQKDPLRRIIKNHFPNAEIGFVKDLGGLIRVCKIKICDFRLNL